MDCINSSTTLLSLPTGVETILLPFISWGEGGLQSILNLRLVCKTTKSWVDNLPPSKAHRVFSNAYIPISIEDFNTSTMKALITYPPPFGVSSFRVSASDMDHRESPLCADKQLLEKLDKYLRPRLHCVHLDLINYNKRLANLFLMNKDKLREISVSIYGFRDFICLKSYINRLKPSNPVQITLRFVGNKIYYEDGHPIVLSSPRGEECLRKFLLTIMKFRDKFTIQIVEPAILNPIEAGLLNAIQVYTDFCNIVESLHFKVVANVSHDLLDAFRGLKSLHIRTHSANLRTITYPYSLENLTIDDGFPVHRLPESLTELTLGLFKSSQRDLFSSMNRLEMECPNLQLLKVNWEVLPAPRIIPFDEFPQRNYDREGFSKLRSLTFLGTFLNRSEVKDIQNLINLAFPWRKMQLKLLRLHLKLSNHIDYIRMIDHNLLENLLIGPTANSILRLDIPDETVTLPGLDIFNNLKDLAAANWKQREDETGRRILPEHPEFLYEEPTEPPLQTYRFGKVTP